MSSNDEGIESKQNETREALKRGRCRRRLRYSLRAVWCDRAFYASCAIRSPIACALKAYAVKANGSFTQKNRPKAFGILNAATQGKTFEGNAAGLEARIYLAHKTNFSKKGQEKVPLRMCGRSARSRSGGFRGHRCKGSTQSQKTVHYFFRKQRRSEVRTPF